MALAASPLSYNYANVYVNNDMHCTIPILHKYLKKLFTKQILKLFQSSNQNNIQPTSS